MVIGTSLDTSTDCDPARADGDTVAASALAPLSESEFMELLVELCVGFAPRRFALGEVYGDYDDGRVLAWGMAFEDRVVLRSDDGQPIGVPVCGARAGVFLAPRQPAAGVDRPRHRRRSLRKRRSTVSKHEKDDPARRDGQRPPDKPLPKEPDPGKHDKKDKK